MKVNDIKDEIFENNKAKGFWDEERNKGEILMLITSELAEALEADRAGRYAGPEALDAVEAAFGSDDYPDVFRANVKDTFEDELADALIRILDTAAGFGIDIERHVRAKLEYNKTRAKRHGKKY